MKFSEKWLREWINPSLDTKQLIEQLTMAGLEVEACEAIDGDQIMELDLTPNRGDCLSIFGLAREVSTLNRLAFKAMDIPTVSVQIENTVEILNEAPAHCPRYCGRMIQNISVNAKTPAWMQERLERSDIHGIHPVVDVLNYVMLELGQPMHAFDLKKLQGGIVIRLAKAEENITLLDGQTLSLNEETLVISDKHQAHAVAGIMGGEHSGVSAGTTDIFLESALFTAHLLAGKARQYGLHTDSSFRYERGVDPALQIKALERATALILEICGGKAGPISEVMFKETLPPSLKLNLHYPNIQKLLGYEIPEAEVTTILTLLGCELMPNGEKTWQVKVPSYRYDITAEIDLIEELVRIVGYDKVPSHLPQTQVQFNPTPQQMPMLRVKQALVDLGFQEIITYSFVDEALQKQLFLEQEALTLLNPISADMGVMRLSLWPGLLTTLKYNQHRQQQRLKLFEVGMCFTPQGSGLEQAERVAGLIYGDYANSHWGTQKRSFDFYDMKRPVEKLWDLMGHSEVLKFEPFNHPACHPGQCAQIRSLQGVHGVVGRLHPKLEQALDLLGPIYLFELNQSFFGHLAVPTFQRPSRFPAIRRDLALIVDKTLPAESLISFVRNETGELLQEAKIFDVYMGKGIDPARKSVAMGLILQHPSRTLIDSEIDDMISKLVTGLKMEFGAQLRD